ncbi:hypothetical protein [Nocardia spumae]|uniref:hypothetical protein n=1 Tax=Nocardia spumae TaxID=2887190 RepID=UPI001D14AF3D|nr:hypothetical protein [Nocardia spumae]
MAGGTDVDPAQPIAEIARGMAEFAPAGWRRLEAWFAMTAVCESALLLAEDGTRTVRCRVSDTVWDAVRRHRAESARSGDGPWWRLCVRTGPDGVEVLRDDGQEPFPGEQMFAPEAYRADLESHPRERLPVWLAAYVGRAEVPSRPPQQAAEQARADRAAGVRAVPVDDELPDLPVLWARWAVLAAAFTTVGSRRGPRIGPSMGVFESAGRSGSTLTLLPGDRAVLSGGVWNAPILDAVYNDGAVAPGFFSGAPKWVTDPVLNPRAMTGLLSFCYWWEAGRWYRGESAPMSECAPAVPAVWTAGTVAGVVEKLLTEASGTAPKGAQELVIAAQSGSVTRATLAHVLGHDARADIDGAFFQFLAAGLAADETDEITEDDAVALVRDHILRRDYDTTGYPLSALRAERLGTGWRVSSPAPAGEIALDRTVFHVADDGVVERSTSAQRAEFVAGFERRFRLRRDGRGVPEES